MNEFERRVHAVDPSALYATRVELLQLNVGLRCNLACSHCHQSSSPDRTEEMSDAVIDASLEAADRQRPALVDITGGAPELHPRIRHIASALRGMGLEVQVRTNLTVLLDPACEDLVELWARHGVRLLASLPSWESEQAERQRGEGTFLAGIEVLRRLNAVGYGTTDRLQLDLASNPDGASLPAPAEEFETRFRRELEQRHGIRFDHLRVLTNMPIGRFRADLGAERQAYLDCLRAGFNGATLPHLACRTSLVVSWDGSIYDCDFNLGARLPVRDLPRTVLDYDGSLATRRIAFGSHCFGCTAQAGSS